MSLLCGGQVTVLGAGGTGALDPDPPHQCSGFVVQCSELMTQRRSGGSALAVGGPAGGGFRKEQHGTRSWRMREAFRVSNVGRAFQAKESV